MLVLAGKIHDHHHLGLGNFIGVDATFADAVMMHMDMIVRGFFNALVEEALKDVNDELHRRVIVVEQQHAVEVWLAGCVSGCG